MAHSTIAYNGDDDVTTGMIFDAAVQVAMLKLANAEVAFVHTMTEMIEGAKLVGSNVAQGAQLVGTNVAQGAQFVGTTASEVILLSSPFFLEL